MRRNAVIVAVCTLIVVLPGCKNNKNKSDASTGAYDPYAYNTTPITPQYEPLSVPAYDTSSTYAAPTQPDTGWATSVADESSFAQYHTVAKGETLYSLARKYYSDQSKWKDIYESNRTSLSDPNRIRVGQRLMIP